MEESNEYKIKIFLVNGQYGFTCQGDDFEEVKGNYDHVKTLLANKLLKEKPVQAGAPKNPKPKPNVSAIQFEDNGNPLCPKCGSSMWDNREGKKNPKAPDWRCKNKECKETRKGGVEYGTALWEEEVDKERQRWESENINVEDVPF